MNREIIARLAQQSDNTTPPFLARHGRSLMMAMGLVLGLTAGAVIERAMTQAVADQIEREEMK